MPKVGTKGAEMKAAEWAFFKMAEQDIPYFTGSYTEAVKVQEASYWKGLARKWWAEADAYEEAVLERAWDSYERFYGASWYLENCQYEEEIERETALAEQASREIWDHLRGRDTIIWDKEEEGEEVKSASVVTASVKARGRALRRRNNAAHRGKSEKGESPFFSTHWLKSQASRRVRRSPCVPSRGGFKKVVSFYAL